MKRILTIAAMLLTAVVAVSCSGDDEGGSAANEAKAVQGSSGTVIGITDTGSFNEGSAFMYKSAQTLYFLLCEGSARSWSEGLKLPHLEIHIWESYVGSDPSALTNPDNAIDINGSGKKVYVCWKAGNGHRFFDKNNYAVADGNYKFESGSLSVSKLMGMYTIAFSGMCADEKGAYSPGWSYSGQFKGM